MIVQKTIRHPSKASTGRGTPCGSVDMIPGDVSGSRLCVYMLSMCTFTGLFLIVSWRELMASVPMLSSWSVTVNYRI